MAEIALIGAKTARPRILEFPVFFIIVCSGRYFGITGAMTDSAFYCHLEGKIWL
jgi:hypothetical protein